jgi:hypothetical protein
MWMTLRYSCGPSETAKAERVKLYRSKSEALEAAGLRE